MKKQEAGHKTRQTAAQPDHEREPVREEKEIIVKRLSRPFMRQILLLVFGCIIIFVLVSHARTLLKLLGILLRMLTPFLAGGALAFIVNIPMRGIENGLFRRVKTKRGRGIARGVSLFLAILFVIALLAGSLLLVVPQIVDSVKLLVQRLPDMVDTLADKMQQYEFLSPMGEKLRSEFSDFSWEQIFIAVENFLARGSGVFDTAISTASSIFGGLVNAVIAIMFMIYILIAKERLSRQSRRLLYAYVKEKSADRITYFLHLLHTNFYGFVRGTLIGALVIGLLTFIGMVILRLPFAGMVSVIIAVTSLVPLIGPFVGVILSTLVVLIVSPFKALIFLIFILILQQIEGNIIYPKIVGNEIGLPAMWTLLAISLGGSIYGIIGMWIAVPLFSVIYILLSETSRMRLTEKGIDSDRKTGENVALTVRTSMGMSMREALGKQRDNRRGKGFVKAIAETWNKGVGFVKRKISRKENSPGDDEKNV